MAYGLLFFFTVLHNFFIQQLQKKFFFAQYHSYASSRIRFNTPHATAMIFFEKLRHAVTLVRSNLHSKQFQPQKHPQHPQKINGKTHQ